MRRLCSSPMPTVRPAQFLLVPLALALAAAPRWEATASASPPDAPGREGGAREIVDRILVVVGNDIITESEVRRRAAPVLARAPEQRGVEAAMLEQLIDERAIAREADDQRVEVSAADVDQALDYVATSQGATVEQIEKAAADSGMSREAYRAEIRRQIVEGKLMRIQLTLTLGPDVPTSGPGLEQALTKARPAWLKGLREKIYIERRDGK